MARDSFFNESIIWSGRPQVVETPPILRAFAVVLFVTAAISSSYAAIWTFVLDVMPTPTVLFAFWCAGLGLAALQVPKLWLGGVEYIVTTEHVIWQRGPFRRTIERNSISFARIFWSKKVPGAGDLELVRAVPTGALRRRLMLRLSAVSAPDRVWAIVRGAEDLAPIGRGERPLAQRLDSGERVIWSARPRPRLRTYLPSSAREWMLLSIALFLILVVVRMLWRAVPTLASLVDNGLPVGSFSFGALVFGLLTTALLVLSIAGYLVYDVIRPGRLVSETRYMITNTRVLIQRSNEELHLDRSRIVDVIDTPAGDGLSDVFLVLDGPRARALAASGAFGEVQRGPHLRPVLEAVSDAESVSRILRNRETELPRAA
jgi:hypothetical protein